MKLEMKLALSTGALVLAMLISASIGYSRIEGASTLSQRITQNRLPVLIDAWAVRTEGAMSVSATNNYVLFGLDEASATHYRQDQAASIGLAFTALRQLQEAAAVPGMDVDPSRLRHVAEIIQTLKDDEQMVVTLNESRQPEAVAHAYTLMQKDMAALKHDLIQTTDALGDGQHAHIAADAAALERANALTVNTLWSATIIGAVCGVFISWVIARGITRALAQVVDRANAIAGGDLTLSELHLTTADQISTLAEAMNRMQHSLAGIIGTVADTAGTLTGSAASMRSASDQIHRRIDQQSQQTQQAATAMQEMSASIAEVSRHTQSAAETARAAAQTAREGGAIVKNMLGAMHQIAASVSTTSSTVGLLGEDSKRISQIVTVIDEIARKTNLLALNAAIEAARAGDQGRGFAVVAGEVRRLAESTAQATGEIASMIQEIQDRTRVAIASMESGTGTVRDGVVTTTQAGEALERIIGMAERVDRMITQIAIAASQQATAADQSSASLDSIHSLSHDNLIEMATTAAGIESLRGTAVTLERQVDRFHVAASHPLRAA